MIDEFQTIQSASEGIYKEKGSKFLAYAYPVKTENEIKSIVAKIKKEHHAARHICYAYVLGCERINYRAFDAGEPPNTAGKPILNQILAYNLTNIIIVVVRYFGGTLLGKGGLIQAYRASAADALSKAIIITDFEEETVEISFNYEKIGDVMKIIKEHSLRILSQSKDKEPCIRLNIRKSKVETICKKFTPIANVNRIVKL